MSSGFLSLIGLKECIGRQNPLEAKEILENASKLFDEDHSKAALDQAVEVLFDSETGTLAFLNKTIKERKLFKDSNTTIFQLWIKIFENHGKEVNFNEYIDEIIACCMKFIISTTVSAKEKELATIVLQAIFHNKLVQSIDVSDIVVKLFEVFNLKTHSETFVHQVLKLLGVISKNFPEVFVGSSSTRCRDIFLKTLEDVVLNEETIKFRALTGAMEGLDLFLHNFAPTPTEEPEMCQRIYVCVKKLTDPPDNIKQKALFRAALTVFTNHATIFHVYIFRDFQYWHKCLLKWLSSNVYEDKRKGIYAVHSLHNIAAKEIIRKNNDYENILKELMKYFRTILESPDSKSYETRIAIRGFGIMAGSCKEFLPDMLQDMLSLVIQRTELISIAEDNELRDSLEHFPDYVQALSQMMLQICNPNIVYVLSQNIQNIVIRLIRDFHYLSRAHTKLVVNSLCQAFYNLSIVNGSSLDILLEKVVVQGVIWTCSRKLVYDASMDWETNIDWKDNITYKNYMPLWDGLLEETETSSYDKPMISRKIFNYLITSLFIILEKLNLGTERRVFSDEQGNNQEFFFCDPNIDLCPIRPADFHIFFNLVDFYRDIFWSKYRRDYFQEWINEYCTKIMEYSVKHPLVSGFLKLLEVGLTAADYLGYFSDTMNIDREALITELSYFLKNLIVKCQRVSDEMQVACLELILKYPVRFYQEYILDLIPIYESAFDLGKSMIWLAKVAIASLEKISEKFDESSAELKIFYEHVLPNLDSYLQSKGVIEDFKAEIIRYKAKKRIRKGTLLKVTETELLCVQKRILSFLGKLDPQNARFVVSKESKENLVKWDVKQNIRIPLYLTDMRPELYLDAIVPRICYLSITSSDRRTKIAACELVHGVVLYLLGTKNHKGRVWKELCTVILTLGADGDATVQQMFEPLITQIMHFMSKYENLNQGVDVLMEALMQGISNNSNYAVRDLSASSLREFVEWSIKQTTPEQLAASPVSIEIILQNLKMYSFDSDVAKRSGAALAFNNLYRKLREEESICDIFFVDLFYTFCINFKLSEELSTIHIGNLNSDIELVSMSLDHVVRVIKERNYLFNKKHPKRQLPAVFTDGVMQEIVLFLLKESGSKLMNYRHKCVEIVEILAPCVQNVSSLTTFLQKYGNKDLFHAICEGEPDGTGIRARPTLDHIKKMSSIPQILIYNWLEHFLSSLDCYCWFLGDNGLLNPEILFDQSNIFSVVGYYLNNVCWKNIYELIEDINPDLLNDTSDTAIKTGTEEMAKIESVKCIISVRIFDFLAKVLESKSADNYLKDFWSHNEKNLIKFVTQVIFEPQLLNFDFKCDDISKKLPQRLENFLNKINRHCGDKNFVNNLKSKIVQTLTERFKELTDTAQETLNSDYIVVQKLNTVRGIIFICKNLKLISSEEFTLRFLNVSARKLLEDLYYGIKQIALQKGHTVNPPNEVKKIANQMMEICFIIDDVSEFVINHILDRTELAVFGRATTITHGEHFFTIYKTTILKQCCSKFVERTLNTIFGKLDDNNFLFITKVLIEIIEFMYKYEKHNQMNLEKLIDITLAYLPKYLEILMNHNEDLIFIEVMSHLAMASPYPMTTFKEKAPIFEKWFLGRLTNKNLSLEYKSKTIILLPLIIGPEDVQNEAISKALEDVQRQHFPLRSNEFAKNSLQETSLKSAFKNLLSAMVTSKSFVILEFIIKCTAPDQNHILNWMIKDEVEIFVNNLNEQQQIDAITKVYKLACNDSFDPKIRHTVLERFLLIMVKSSSGGALVKFYTNEIKGISNLIESNYGISNSGWPVEHALMNRIIGYSLIELMAFCLSKDEYTSKECTIARALLGEIKTGNELLGTLTKKAFYARTEVFVTNDKSAAEFFRIYQCSAYCAICSLVSNTQIKLGFYSKFIFEENTTKNELIWQKLIDCSPDKEYIFLSQEVENYPKIKERFVSIRKMNPTATATRTSSKYLQTQNVFGSSLSQHVSKVDLNYSNVRNDSEVLARTEKKSQQIVSVNLEKINLNMHEVMPTLCGVINHMYENKITPVSEDQTVKRTFPWLTSIANAMCSMENHKNIRVFLAQVVDNCKDVFKHYAHIMFRPILEVLVDECAGSQLSFFATDLISLLLSWTSTGFHKPSSTDEARLTSSLLKFLIRNVWHEKPVIFKFNLELIHTMISLWKDIIGIPSQLLLDMITKSQRADSKENQCGIAIVAIVLANDLVPWTETTKLNFFQAVFTNLKNENSSIYQSAAHVVGMILKNLKLINDTDNLEKLRDNLVILLKGFSKKKEKVFIDILFGIQKSFVEIIDSFREIISFKIPTAIGTIKKNYLEMFLVSLESYEGDGIYNVLISIGLKDLLKKMEYQLLGLHIINRALPKMDESQVNNLFPLIEACTESNKPECRDVTYEILIFITLNFSQNLGNRSTCLLLKGLVDTESQIQKRIFQFWSQEADIPTRTTDRIVKLIADYSSDCEKQFLGFCTQLIFEPAIQNPDSKRQIFEFETDRDAKLMEYNINTNSRIKSSSTLPPLFAGSQQFRQSLLTGSQMCNFVRETAAGYFFEPTQDPVKLTEARQNFSLPSQSLLPFSIQPEVLDRRSHKVSSEPAAHQTREITQFRNRFLKDKEKENRERTLKIIDYRTMQKQNMALELKKKQGQVVLFRRYRFGDYPDLLINGLAILLPLQGLVKRDPIIARQIFVALFNAIVQELGPEAKMFIISTGNKIQTILENAKTCEPTVFATFLEIALLKPENFAFSPKTVAMVSKASKMLTVGAIYLENRINEDTDTDNLSSRSGSTMTLDQEHWLHLSDIYNSLAEYDIVAAIFSDKIQADPRIAEAIDLKANGRYQETQEKLWQVIERRVVLEQYYSYNCYYECYLELGDWKNLSQTIQNQIDDFEDLWTDEYNTDFLLPKLVQAELHLILEGQSKSDDFLRILERWIVDPIKAEHIKQNFCEELMMLHIGNKDFRQARVYGEYYLKTYLMEWGVISSLFNKLRLENLLNAQKVAEIDNYAVILLEDFTEKSVETLRQRWANCTIKSSDSLKFWNCIIAYRNYIAALIMDTMENFDLGSLATTLQSSLYDMDLQLLQAAIDRKNYGITEKVLNRLSPLKTNNESNRFFEYQIAEIKQKVLNGQRVLGRNSIPHMEQAWIQSRNLLEDENLKNYCDLNIKVCTLYSDIGEEMIKIISEHGISDSMSKNLMKLADKSKSGDIHQRIFDQSFWSLQQATTISESLGNISDLSVKSVEIVGSSFYKLSQFCYDYLDHNKIQSSKYLERILIKSVCTAMQFDSKEARQLFPCILQIPSIETAEFKQLFKECSSEIPEWMFLTWVPQIISRLSFENANFLDPIIKRIAMSYPNALIYPFYAWYDRFVNLNCDRTDDCMLRAEIGEIVNLLKNPVNEKFIESLKTLCVPEVFLLSHLENFLKESLNVKNMSQKNYENNINDFIQKVTKNNENIQGSAFRRIYKYAKYFEKLKQLNFEKEHVNIRRILVEEIFHKLRNATKYTEQDVSIETLCPWFSQFQWCGEETFLELPGQYDGNKRPNVQNHIKIVKFGQRVKVFRTLRCPLKLLIYGSNGKSYEFLVKYGEDLKQDQRIQQLLRLMSEKLQEDQNCRNHNLYIRTYSVVPIDQFCGMLTWVHDTIAIQEFLLNCLLCRNPSGQDLMNNVFHDYVKFIKHPSKDDPNTKQEIAYGKAADTYSINEIIANFRNLENVINLDILKYALNDISVSPESFFVLRNNFATSLSAMSIAHYVLGIGDRHLQNILISTKDGSLTGVDFGITFGSGVRDLHVPEMVPFRLTPHIVQTMAPMGTSGIIHKCMVHSLRVFRNSEKILMACMEVFVREPTANWINVNRRRTIDCDEILTHWEPKDRIDIARCKLLGYNPMQLIERELNVSVIASRFPKYLPGYLKILHGRPQFNIRARLPENGLTVEDQVKCLIDIATDPAILGITFEGFLPWI